MKHCTKCGNELLDGTFFCESCGAPVATGEPVKRQSGIVTAIKVFLIIGTVVNAISTYGIALAWCLPMTISYLNKVEKGVSVGLGFKICTLLFVNLIAGIMMLTDTEKQGKAS